MVANFDHSELFATKKESDYHYSDWTGVADGTCNLFFPVEADSEFTTPSYDINKPHHTISTTLTVQYRGINLEKGLLFSHPDFLSSARHEVFHSGFSVVEYLRKLGYQAKLKHRNFGLSNLPWIQFDIYAFFAVAELFRLFNGEYLEDIRNLCVHPTQKTGIEQGRRVRTFTQMGQYFSWIEMPWVLILNGFQYQVRLSIYDTCALQGTAKYRTLCANTGVKLEYKDLFNEEEKSQMDLIYLERPEDFENYALGDLYNYPALLGNEELFNQVYCSLGLEDFIEPPRLTIGATVSRLFEASLLKHFGISEKQLLYKLCEEACADTLKENKNTTGAFNAKVDGGRCRNSRPTEPTGNGAICDLDISGCYGEGLREQDYPLGVPVVIDYPIKSDRNKYLSLREFLKNYSSFLVPGLWQARVSLPEDYKLKYQQDYLISWLPPHDISKMPSDTELNETDEWWSVDNVGLTKIFTHEIQKAIITHDFIQWLENVATHRQRKELLDKLQVVTAIYYPADERVNSFDELLDRHKNHKGENTCTVEKRQRKTSIVSIKQECHAWLAVNMGDLLVSALLMERKKHPKNTPLNTLYKLCINTVYGDMVSPFFKIGNVIVGNNITARARALAWLMEKGLHGWQSITDGCAFDLNRVIYSTENVRVSSENTQLIYLTSKKPNISIRALGGLQHIENIWAGCDISGKTPLARLKLTHKNGDVEELDIDQSLSWVNKIALSHLQNIFPNVDVLHKETTDTKGQVRKGQFEFEAKGIYDKGCFHGTANYLLTQEGVGDPKMRSYSKKPHKVIIMSGDILKVIADDYHPSQAFLEALQNKPESIPRGLVFIKKRILKISDYRRNFEATWKYSEAFPGSTIEQTSLLRECSLTAFTFQSEYQFKAWSREADTLRRKTGQTYEQFFLNPDGTLNFLEMAQAIDTAIRAGLKGLFDGRDLSRHKHRLYKDHPQLQALKKCRDQLQKRYGQGVEEEPEDYSNTTY